MNWAALSAVFSGINFVTLLGIAFYAGRKIQLLEDINEKGCQLRRNGCTEKR